MVNLCYMVVQAGVTVFQICSVQNSHPPPRKKHVPLQNKIGKQFGISKRNFILMKLYSIFNTALEMQ